LQSWHLLKGIFKYVNDNQKIKSIRYPVFIMSPHVTSKNLMYSSVILTMTSFMTLWTIWICQHILISCSPRNYPGIYHSAIYRNEFHEA
jgi:hypothetical protein